MKREKAWYFAFSTGDQSDLSLYKYNKYILIVYQRTEIRDMILLIWFFKNFFVFALLLYEVEK